ncbi:MAG: beta-propeller domain-containing protein, partial [Candidatus Heimdallarchaeota archaeon]|nr:beta-propeller domain-containing protein [Candidatus Heimdallarchaeota archaeon]
MVQKEVKRKTKAYGIVALLSATILVSMIYAFGTVPGLFPTSDLPSVLAMENFDSYEELKTFLATNTKDSSINYFGGSPLDNRVFESLRGDTFSAPIPAPMGETALDSSTKSYSTTNIQVSGVDESDIVKTDGKYIYVATTNNYYSNNQNSIYIVKADPQDPRVIAEITLSNETYIAGLFLSQDSNKLIVLGSQYQLYNYIEPRLDIAIYPYYDTVSTIIKVYDISDKAHPIIARNFTLSGSYFNSRMIGDYLYAVVSQPAYNLYEDKVLIPQVNQNTESSEISPERIFYTDTVDTYFTFTTFVGLNVIDDVEQISNMTILMGGTSTMYVSVDNLY